MKIDYVTSNDGKFKEAQLILSGWVLERVNLELPELQGEREEISKAKAKSALDILKRPLIVEDVSVHCNALKGLPGPYIKDFLKHLGDDGLMELVHKFDDHSCHVICTVAFVQPGGHPQLFEGIIHGTVVAPRGALKHGRYSWNTCFQPNGSDKTFGEMTYEDLARFSMRAQALNKLKDYLEQQ